MKEIKIRDWEQGDEKYFPETIKNYINNRPAGILFTGILEDTGEVVFTCGIIDSYPGAGEVWLNLCTTKYVNAARAVKSKLHEICKGYKRIQALADSQENKRWLEWLGFVEEGYLKNVPPFWKNSWIMRYAPGDQDGN